MAHITITAEQSKQEIIVSRVLDAPRNLVFNVYTDPRHIPNWWGPKHLTTRVDKLEPVPGGSWRFVQNDSAGNEYAFHGVYHDVVPPERIVATFEFEGMPGRVLLTTTTFGERGGKTELIEQSVFQSVADRDGMLHAGMEIGATESTERLEALLFALTNT